MKTSLALLLLVAVLLVVPAINNFRNYSLRSKATEARSNLGRILERQRAFANKHGHFATIEPEGNDPSQSWNRAEWENRTCDVRCGSGQLETCRQFSCLDLPVPPAGVYYRYACTATQSESFAQVTCAAASDLDADGEVGLFVASTALSGGIPVTAPIPKLGFDLEPVCKLSRLEHEEVVHCTSRNRFIAWISGGAW